jgi:hypothetical protein
VLNLKKKATAVIGVVNRHKSSRAGLRQSSRSPSLLTTNRSYLISTASGSIAENTPACLELLK